MLYLPSPSDQQQQQQTMIDTALAPVTNTITRDRRPSVASSQDTQNYDNYKNELTASNNNGSGGKSISIPTSIDTPSSDWSSKLSSLFSFSKKKSNYELEIDAFKDAMIYIRPISNEEGILVHRLDKSKKYIHSLAELEIGYIYLTERDTPIIRQNQHEVIFANKIIIQCKSYKKFSIKGILQQDIATSALEAFTKRKMNQGMLFIEEDGQLCRIFYRINDLILNTIYANQDDTVMLQRLQNNEIRFLFEGHHAKEQVEVAIAAFTNPSSPKDWKRISVLREQNHHSSQGPLSSDNIATRFLNKFQPRSKVETMELKQKRENTINKLKSRMRIDWEWKNQNDTPTGGSTGSDENNMNAVNIMENVVNRVKSRMSIINKPGSAAVSAPTAANYQPSKEAVGGGNTQDKSSNNVDGAAKSTPVDSTPVAGEGATAPPAPPPAPPPPPPPPPLNSKLLLKQRKKEKKMRQLHWSVIPKDKLKETFWDSLSPVKSNEKDQSLVEQWFSLSPPPKPVGGLKDKLAGKSGGAPTIVNLLDLRRANNACILLAQFKLSYADIKEAILSCDEQRLSVEQLIAIDAMLPITEEEAKKLNAFNGDRATLGNAERFFIEMMAIDNLQQRVQTFLFRAEVSSVMTELTISLGAVTAALDQVRASRRFIQMLKVILHVGTILNRGQTYLHGKGFRLDSLAKLSETKSRDEKHTVIDFIVGYVRDNKPELMSFYEELSAIDAVANLSLEVLLDDVEHLGGRFKQVEEQLALATIDANYSQLMRPFYQANINEFGALKQMAEATMRQFTECCTYFGEDSATISTKEFFGNIAKFSSAFKRSAQKLKVPSPVLTRRESVVAIAAPPSAPATTTPVCPQPEPVAAIQP
ncbi:hypothetical protein SAMD00019534_017240 [Acytostelium subglobosum LB1]|uniref:hypothetical protein n=1 Tax=Acytostelium subglobosum LB1 TaxID=1410327 RepID=UPI0006451BBA|nr:hypothetical protein SAMD00019534_017240 [Acytostelium subglobosum LB1]GAM18549.1 hypothetical protein SAMD00019534_017240 [Acytostelium subglobosum LB1]|eukprot:XP_012757769.1 hypothetical protein SAMD00019534_017240 [Acytostelium subglobosum LB1]